MTDFISRTVDLVVFSREQSEGVGARVRRTIGTQELRSFDPFLMLDEFKTARPGGFPDHPHRGFSTVTFLFPDSKGAIVHEDFAGHQGVLKAGGVQWMTAGKGVVHSEMPVDDSPAHGLQLWVNLPRKIKMIEPSYQELEAKDMVKVSKDGVTALVIAGEALGATSPIISHTPVHYAHFTMQPNSKLEQSLNVEFSTFLYTLKGKGTIGTEQVEAHYVVTLKNDGDGIQVTTGASPFEFVIVSGEKINEPVYQHGPFVMTTSEEIHEAMRDFQQGTNGFEQAKSWISKSGH